MNYFDHAASSIIYQEVLDVLAQSMREDFANPSALHILGQNLHERTEVMREDFLKALGASVNDVFIFTSSATESNNTVIHGINLKEGDVVVYCKADHPSVTVPVEHSAKELKLELRKIVLDKNGAFDTDVFSSLLDENVKLVVLTHVNNQSGVVNDIASLSKKIKEITSAHVHVDAVQSFGKINFKINPEIDSMSFTSHKIGGPKGIAGLYLKNSHKIKPLLLGGAHENGMRSSTLAFPLIAGFHKAMKISLENTGDVFSKTARFSELITAKLSSIDGIQFPFKTISPFIVSFILPGISSDIIMRHLEMKNVFISSTSACSSKIPGFNPSLHAMNVPEKFHKNFLRISLAASTTQTEVEMLLQEFQNVWDNLKHMRGR
ncbi:MAG: aminotransferase class V-fold PLP-dependent enzyme [Bacteriovorax sp.]|nr:aminotransferase class V-fold PLP-dependent enzyme [Bacteriovorax sp.]